MRAGQIPTRQVEGLDAALADTRGVALAKTATISAVKDSANPTLTETGSMPENIIKVGATYWMLYSRRPSGLSARLHLASSSSPAGPWTPYGGNPVLTCGSQSWEGPETNGGCLLEHDGVFYLFYAADTATSKIGGIGVATAPSVTGPYTKYASNPILSPGAAGAWDERRVQEPDVKIADDGTWVMAFMAESMSGTQGQTEKVGIATAASPFGPWTKSVSNPVIGFGAAGDFDQGGAADPSLFHESGVWWCLYSGLNTGGAKPWQLGLAYADAPDGPWTRHAGNPILAVGGVGSFEETAVWRGALYRQGSTYHFPYGGIPASGFSTDAKGGNARLVISAGGQLVDAHESDLDPHPQYLTGGEGDARYVRAVNGVGPDSVGNVAVSAPTAELLMQDGVTAPPVPLETEGRDDWLYKG